MILFTHGGKIFMSKHIRLSLWLLLTIVLIFSSGCAGNNANDVPTVDPNTLFTAAAMTVQAEFTEAAALIPTLTATFPPTPTQETTVAAPPPFSTSTGFPPPAGTQQAGIPTLPGISSTLPSIGTQSALPGIATETTTGGTCGGDKAEWISNSPADGKHFQASANFDLLWKVKNTGTTTWTEEYVYRHAFGSNYATRREYNFWNTPGTVWEDGVQPGEEVEFIVHMVAPSEAGHYEMYWVLTNPETCNFRGLSFEFYVD